jgi:polyhydroxybutyrate depolymerase
MRSMADTAGFFVVYPTALEDPNDGNATNWTHKPPTMHDDVGFVAGMIDSIAAAFAVDRQRVYACGYSNGGEFCFDLACRLSDRIAAIGVVATTIYFEDFNTCSPVAPMPLLSIHGTADFIRPYNGLSFGGFEYYKSVNDQMEQFKGINSTDDVPLVVPVPDINPGDGSTVTQYIWSNGVGCSDVEHMRVEGGGHDWPGTFGNMDIDASVEAWRFMRRYRLDGKIGCNPTPVCETTTAPQNLTSNVTASSVDLQWDVVPQSLACQVAAEQVAPISGASGNRVVLGLESEGLSVPRSVFPPGSTWEWRLRCACSLSPLDLTPFSGSVPFTIPVFRDRGPGGRILDAETAMLHPNPANNWVHVRCDGLTPGMLDLRILDMHGKTWISVQQALEQGTRLLRLDTSGLPEGIYLLHSKQKDTTRIQELQILR